MTRKARIIESCKRLNLAVDIHPPGDGHGPLHYDFYAHGRPPFTFARQLSNCCGIREAERFVGGYAAGAGRLTNLLATLNKWLGANPWIADQGAWDDELGQQLLTLIKGEMSNHQLLTEDPTCR